MKYKNMKIEINAEQTLSDVVVELERLGYHSVGFPTAFKRKYYVCSSEFGGYTTLMYPLSICKIVTLIELKQMEKLL